MDRYYVSLVAIIAAMCIACQRYDADPVPISRLDKALSEYADADSTSRANIRHEYAQGIDAFFGLLNIQADDSTLAGWSRGPVVKAFQAVVDSIFPNLSDLQQQLGYVVANAEADSLHIPQLDFVAVAWGKPHPVMRYGNTMLIALNHYLGADFDGYSHLEVYRRADKTPQALPYDVAGAVVATQYPFHTNGAPTLLNWMLYEGALAYAKMQLLDAPQLHQALGYTPAQLELLEDNFQEIWREMSLRKLVHSTDPATIDRFLAASPATPLLRGTAPGRTGRYVGYMLVLQYLKSNPGAKLSFLLSPDFYDNPAIHF